MANELHFTGGQASIWMQPNGPGTDMVYLGCHEVASIDEPLGDYNPFFCPNPEKTKGWVVAGETFSPPEAVTADIVEDVTDALAYLEKQKCPFPVYINKLCNGRRDIFTNYRRTFILDTRRITNRSYSEVAMIDSDERSRVTHSLSAAPPLIKVVDIEYIEQTLPDATGTGA